MSIKRIIKENSYDISDVKDYIEYNSDNIQEVKDYLSKVGVSYNETEINGNFFIIFDEYICYAEGLDDFPTLEEIEEFFLELDLSQIYNLFDFDYEEYFTDHFWNEMIGKEFEHVYHATDPDNIPSIVKNGLQLKQDSHGFNNKEYGKAIYTVYNVDLLAGGSYGDAIVEINVGEMKSDGFIPMVLKEPEFMVYEAKLIIAQMLKVDTEIINPLGITETGVWQETVIFFESIPPQYLNID